MDRSIDVVFIDLEFVSRRVVLVPADQDVDVPVECGREQQGLPVGRRLVKQALHVREESHVRHPVRLVYDHDLHRVEPNAAALDEVPESAGQATATSTPRDKAFNCGP